MANEISRVIYTRARAAGRLHMEQIVAMYETQRQATATLDYILTRRRGRTRLLLLDMDGTLTPAALCGRTGARHRPCEAAWPAAGRRRRCRHPQRAHRGAVPFVHQQQFERVAQALPLRPGVIACINRMRRAGFMVGVVSDSYFVAAEILRRRVFADFALAHTLQFDGRGVLWRGADQPGLRGAWHAGPALCKSHVMRRLRDDRSEPRLSECWAVGDNLNDLGMLRAADRAFVIDPKHPHWRAIPMPCASTPSWTGGSSAAT
jgi:glucosyl-3-phosphoglycerate synthase